MKDEATEDYGLDEESEEELESFVHSEEEEDDHYSKELRVYQYEHDENSVLASLDWLASSMKGLLIVLALLIFGIFAMSMLGNEAKKDGTTVTTNGGATTHLKGTGGEKESNIDLVAKLQPISGEMPVLGLDSSKFAAISQVVLSVGRVPQEFIVDFTVEEVVKQRSTKTCTAPDNEFVVAYIDSSTKEGGLVSATHVGCIVSQNSGLYVWHYYVADMVSLRDGAKFDYKIGEKGLEKGFFKAQFRVAPRNRPLTFVVLGDTGEEKRKEVFESIMNRIDSIDAVIHVGDQGYVSNKGTCWNIALQTQKKCRYDCPRSDSDCEGRHRQIESHMKEWSEFFADIVPFTSRIPLMTTIGNHDNDLQWFYKFRPPTSVVMPHVIAASELSDYAKQRLDLISGELKGQESASQQGLVNELLVEPFFFSFDLGQVHFISIQSENNGIDAYERATSGGEMNEEEKKRFETFFGPSSAQYKWLEHDLSTVDRSRTPWVVVFTHRPPFHTSSHHPNCAPDGDYYKCGFRMTYAPLFEKYGVNLVANGHSHHYSRSTPIHLNKENQQGEAIQSGKDARDLPVYTIVGTGGMRLDGRFSSSPPWMAYRTDRDFGYGLLTPHNNTHMEWQFVSVTQQDSIIDHAYFLQKDGDSKKRRMLLMKYEDL